MRPIANKRDFVRRYQAGHFGNAGPTWGSVEQFLKEHEIEWPDYNQLFHLRNRVPGGITGYNCTFNEIRMLFTDQFSAFNWPDMYVSAMAPTEKTKIQGEVSRTSDGLRLECTNIRKPMREALLERRVIITGLKAKLKLQGYMDSPSFDWLMELLDEYPNHIIEFSTYSVEWGTVPGYNTVFWEVRPDRSFYSNQSQFTQVY